MKNIMVQNDFRLAVLELDDLEVYFQSRKLAYEDLDNHDNDHNRDQVLKAMEEDGSDYVESIFHDPHNVAFAFFKGDTLIGSAELYLEPDKGKVLFATSHIAQGYKGQGLSKILHQARDQYVLEQTHLRQAWALIRPGNTPSIKAAERNGFEQNGVHEKGWLIFEKTLDV